MNRHDPIYKIVPAALWLQAEAAGQFDGSPVDVQDGFIHFSTSQQLRETAEKHFQGQSDLLLVAVDPRMLGEKLQWEPSRGGALFPHLYGPLHLGAVIFASDLPMTPDGRHIIPESIR
ncbi:DUF952 domain-containing protein [Aureimonas fodinaquatilis]|uniref:DUF952 domain-containing protein n=1 Tax=Aureimonas fodinaquatilis TaxID=2565783 RepID=A0A5B0DY37_9HYPH|nr:DUF952 domain-containing protein [Aureimonas fodinaquatilis]KAA0970922.1 DUF952 domain-containing protein [Aureimonas fodinaquatilis]